MTDTVRDDETFEFVSRFHKSFLEADSIASGQAAIDDLFAPDFEFYINGHQLGADWLRDHVPEIKARLRDVDVDVTHAVRHGNVVMERHVINAVDVASNTPWRAEIMSVGELNPDGKFFFYRELVGMLEGVYEGGW